MDQHERVVQAVAENLKGKGYSVMTNTKSARAHGVELSTEQVIFPDVFTYIGNVIGQIYEVETSSTIMEASTEQWLTYSGAVSEFFLVVPEGDMEKTKVLVAEYNIKVKDFWFFPDNF